MLKNQDACYLEKTCKKILKMKECKNTMIKGKFNVYSIYTLNM